MIKFNILNRASRKPQFTAEINCAEDTPLSIKIGLAVMRAISVGADLTHTDLIGAHLANANLVGANLAGADLIGANLAGADLTDVNLAGANLAGANLACANLTNANLTDSKFTSINPMRAFLAGADPAFLVGADPMHAPIEDIATLGYPDGWAAWTYLTQAKEQRVQIGCRNKTIAEGRQYWAGKENRREVMAALDYAEAIAKIRGWASPSLRAASQSRYWGGWLFFNPAV
jgi:hypothetical protein